MHSHFISQNKDLVAASTLYAELSNAAAIPGSNYNALERVRQIINSGTNFEASAAAIIRQLIARALIEI